MFKERLNHITKEYSQMREKDMGLTWEEIVFLKHARECEVGLEEKTDPYFGETFPGIRRWSKKESKNIIFKPSRRGKFIPKSLLRLSRCKEVGFSRGIEVIY